MAIFMNPTCRPAEGTFKSETIDQTEFPPHDHTGSGFSRFLYDKVAVWETEMLRVATEQEWEYPLFKAISFLVRASIHKQVLLSGVTMKITEEKDVPTLERLPHHHLDRIVFRVHF